MILLLHFIDKVAIMMFGKIYFSITDLYFCELQIFDQVSDLLAAEIIWGPTKYLELVIEYNNP